MSASRARQERLVLSLSSFPMASQGKGLKNKQKWAKPLLRPWKKRRIDRWLALRGGVVVSAGLLRRNLVRADNSNRARYGLIRRAEGRR